VVAVMRARAFSIPCLPDEALIWQRHQQLGHDGLDSIPDCGQIDDSVSASWDDIQVRYLRSRLIVIWTLSSRGNIR